MRFLDTNVLLRYFMGDNAEMAKAAWRLLKEIERGDEKVVTTETVVFETVYTLQRTYGVSREEIQWLLSQIISLPGIRLTEKQLCLQALEMFVHYRISFADAYTTASMIAQGIDEIYSWDTDFDKIEGITRVSPSQ